MPTKRTNLLIQSVPSHLAIPSKIKKNARNKERLIPEALNFISLYSPINSSSLATDDVIPTYNRIIDDIRILQKRESQKNQRDLHRQNVIRNNNANHEANRLLAIQANERYFRDRRQHNLQQINQKKVIDELNKRRRQLELDERLAHERLIIENEGLIRFNASITTVESYLKQIPTTLTYNKSIFHIADFTYTFGMPPNIVNRLVAQIPESLIPDFFDTVIKLLYDTLIAHTAPDIYFRILLESCHSPVSTSLLAFNELSFDDFVAKFFTTYEASDLWEGKFTIQTRRIPSGGQLTTRDIPACINKPKGIDLIFNNDGLCGQRCLVLADASTDNEKKNIKKRPANWDKRTLKLCTEIGVEKEMSFTDFEIWANIRHRQVVILSDLFHPIYMTEHEYPNEKVYLYYDAKIEHYHHISNVNALTNNISRNYKWCVPCNASYRFDDGCFANHKCVELSCYFCKDIFLSVAEKENHFVSKTWLPCNFCNCKCPTVGCLEKHKVNCKGCFKKCLKCKSKIAKNHFDEHICGEIYCKSCDIYHTDPLHRCFIKPTEKTKTKIDCWVYDFESGFTVNNIHYVNKCVAMQLFSNEVFVCNTIEEFIAFVITKKNTTWIAHNSKSYDGWLIHKYLLRETNIRPNKIILAGQKIMLMRFKSHRFIDSLNHIAQPLCDFPATFNLKELKKGFFPYTFNTVENFNYIGTIPDKIYFNCDGMTSKKFKEFNIWYDLQKDVLYNFQKELYEYCYSDTMILKQSMEQYIQNGLELTGINPIMSSTIASYSMKVFRTNFMQENQIAILTQKEYDFIKKGFYGGRTEVFQLQTHAEDAVNGKFIKYVDINSLYPTVQHYDEIPCGIPKWGYGNLNDVFGYAEVDIIPPKNIHLPLLPEKKNGKLIFDLSNKSRAVYSTVELKKAVELGYTISNIYNTLSFESSREIFKEYNKTFLKIKLETSGYARNKEEDGSSYDDRIEKYILDTYNHCGVQLEKHKIIANKGMKTLSKMLLNSLWGKFGQKSDLRTTEYINNPDTFIRLLQKHKDKKISLKNETQIDEKTVFVEYEILEELKTSLQTTNIGIAGFVTAQARLRLYCEMEKLQERVIYCDTDSLFYHYDINKYNVIEGNMLGQWESEEDEPIVSMLAIAPKTYGYTLQSGSSTVKCKGISLNNYNSKQFNMISLKDLIINKNPIVTKKMEFIKKNHVITTVDTEKLISFQPDRFKRNINIDFTTTPYIV